MFCAERNVSEWSSLAQLVGNFGYTNLCSEYTLHVLNTTFSLWLHSKPAVFRHSTLLKHLLEKPPFQGFCHFPPCIARYFQAPLARSVGNSARALAHLVPYKPTIQIFSRVCNNYFRRHGNPWYMVCERNRIVLSVCFGILWFHEQHGIVGNNGWTAAWWH